MPLVRYDGCRHTIERDPEGGHKMTMSIELKI